MFEREYLPSKKVRQHRMLAHRTGNPCLSAQPDACVGTSTRCTQCRRPLPRSTRWCVRASKDGGDDDRGVNWDAAWSEFKSTAKKGAWRRLLTACRCGASQSAEVVLGAQASQRLRAGKRQASREGHVAPPCRSRSESRRTLSWTFGALKQCSR